MPGLDEHALVVVVEPLEEEDVFQPCGGGGEGRAERRGVTLWRALDAAGGGHLSADAGLEMVQHGDLLEFDLGDGIDKVDAAACDVAEKVSGEFYADGALEACELEFASDGIVCFVGEVAAEKGVAEKDIHCGNYKRETGMSQPNSHYFR